MKLSFLFAAALAGTAAAFRPQANAPLARTNAASPDVRPGAPLTKAEMVAIRSPFWNALQPEAEAKVDYIVDRDYTVALTLLCVGIGLAMFPPSE